MNETPRSGSNGGTSPSLPAAIWTPAVTMSRTGAARAALEATAFQTREVLEAMEKDSKIRLHSLRTDGGMVKNDLLMQFQADILNIPVERPVMQETTALGAAYAAGLAVGYYKDLEDLRANWAIDYTWHPHLEESEREALYKSWKKAVTRSLDWAD